MLTAFSRKAFLEFKSCLRGRWPLPGGAMWAGKRLGGGRRRSRSWRITMSLKAYTGCGCAGRRKWLMGGRDVLQLGCAGGLSTKKHMCPCKQDRRWSPSSNPGGRRSRIPAEPQNIGVKIRRAPSDSRTQLPPTRKQTNKQKKKKKNELYFLK